MSSDVAAALEQAEAEEMFDLATLLPEAIRSQLGVSSDRLHGGVALSVLDDPDRFWSKALGFGFDGPVNRGMVGDIIDRYREWGPRKAVLQFAPSVLPVGWEAIAAEFGLERGAGIVKFLAKVDDVVGATAAVGPGGGLLVEPVRPQDALDWARALVTGMGMTGTCSLHGAAATTFQDAWRPFGVRDASGRFVAGGNMRLYGRFATLFAAATLPEARNLGAQGSLVAARARAAQAAGCEWLIVETGPDSADAPNTSYRNMRRYGFEVVYQRPDWTWTPGPA